MDRMVKQGVLQRLPSLKTNNCRERVRQITQTGKRPFPTATKIWNSYDDTLEQRAHCSAAVVQAANRHARERPWRQPAALDGRWPVGQQRNSPSASGELKIA
eukprot:364258-Chlamydomonas_euryale.AAC.6